MHIVYLATMHIVSYGRNSECDEFLYLSISVIDYKRTFGMRLIILLIVLTQVDSMRVRAALKSNKRDRGLAMKRGDNATTFPSFVALIAEFYLIKAQQRAEGAPFFLFTWDFFFSSSQLHQREKLALFFKNGTLIKT